MNYSIIFYLYICVSLKNLCWNSRATTETMMPVEGKIKVFKSSCNRACWEGGRRNSRNSMGTHEHTARRISTSLFAVCMQCGNDPLHKRLWYWPLRIFPGTAYTFFHNLSQNNNHSKSLTNYNSSSNVMCGLSSQIYMHTYLC